VTGGGHWGVYRTFEVPPGKEARHRFPDAYAACWLRVTASRDCRATAWLDYR